LGSKLAIGGSLWQGSCLYQTKWISHCYNIGSWTSCLYQTKLVIVTLCAMGVDWLMHCGNGGQQTPWIVQVQIRMCCQRTPLQQANQLHRPISLKPQTVQKRRHARIPSICSILIFIELAKVGHAWPGVQYQEGHAPLCKAMPPSQCARYSSIPNSADQLKFVQQGCMKLNSHLCVEAHSNW
jgi:hypothetical protein